MDEDSVFEDCVFYFPNADEDYDVYVKKIEAAGGFISKILNKRVTHVVSEDGDVDQGQTELVTPDYITECVKKQKKLDEDDFRPNNSNNPKSKKRKTEEPKQTAKWHWQSDNGWVEYESAVAQRLEKAYQNGEDEVKVDKERFIDITSMLQVRYDDKNKRRPVKRTASNNDKKKQKMLDSDSEEAGNKVKVIKKGAAAVDVASKYAKNHHVVEEPNCIWDIKLNQTDIKNNNNKFYIVQLLEPDQGKGYILWTRWGRVGSPGQNKAEYFDSKEQAKKVFKKKFQDKTGNLWEDRKDFEKQPGKYQIVDIDYNDDDEEETTNNNNNNNQNKVQKKINIPNSQLDKTLRDLISLICDVRQLNSAMMEFEIDIKRMPLGKLSKKQIKKGYEILKEVEELLNGNAKNIQHKLVDCSNRFYTLIPHSFGKKVPPILNTKKLLQDKMSMLETLADIEIASKILQQGQDLDENPIDTQYKSLHAEMEPLAHDSDEFEMVLTYLERTHAPTHDQYTLSVDEVFKVTREGEAQNFEPWKKSKNRQLLWHGSRLTNWLGILSQGLRIAPPEAPVTGYMFGKGVYFADFVTKSANYCHATKANPTGILLLCEVALGNMLKKRQAEFIQKLPDGYQSCMGEGQWEPDPNQHIELPNGLMVPMGEPAKTDAKDSALLYNEFIVYDTSQIVTRYLVRVTFKFK